MMTVAGLNWSTMEEGQAFTCDLNKPPEPGSRKCGDCAYVAGGDVAAALKDYRINEADSASPALSPEKKLEAESKKEAAQKKFCALRRTAWAWKQHCSSTHEEQWSHPLCSNQN